MAVDAAGLASGGYDPDSTGVILGSGIGGLKSFEEEHDVYRRHGPGKISAFFIPKLIADIAAGIVSMRFDARGPNFATVSACATSAHAIGEAFRTIQYGDADVIIAGGAEATVTPMAIGGFTNMKALSERNDSPETASRPFDATRDGFVMGEGAGIVILEDLAHARRRGARIHAELVGDGATAGGGHPPGGGWGGAARPPMRPTWRRPRPTARARSGRCTARCGTRASAPPTSTTSTPMARPRPPTTSTRRRPSRRSSGRTRGA